jgi:hypothetical protein
MMYNVFGFFGFYFEIKTNPKRKKQKNHGFYYAWFFESRTLSLVDLWQGFYRF